MSDETTPHASAEDARIHEAMKMAHARDPAPPDFEQMWASAQAEAARPAAATPRWAKLGAAAAACALLGLGAALAWFAQDATPNDARVAEQSLPARGDLQGRSGDLSAVRDEARALSEWEAPTDFLLTPPMESGAALMEETPTFGGASL